MIPLEANNGMVECGEAGAVVVEVLKKGKRVFPGSASPADRASLLSTSNFWEGMPAQKGCFSKAHQPYILQTCYSFRPLCDELDRTDFKTLHTNLILPKDATSCMHKFLHLHVNTQQHPNVVVRFLLQIPAASRC